MDDGNSGNLTAITDLNRMSATTLMSVGRRWGKSLLVSAMAEYEISRAYPRPVGKNRATRRKEAAQARRKLRPVRS